MNVLRIREKEKHMRNIERSVCLHRRHQGDTRESVFCERAWQVARAGPGSPQTRHYRHLGRDNAVVGLPCALEDARRHVCYLPLTQGKQKRPQTLPQVSRGEEGRQTPPH